MKSSLLGVSIRQGGAALAALLLCSCIPATTEPQGKVEAGQKAHEEAASASEAGVLKKPDVRFLIKDDLYAVPIAVDADGCEQFTTWSESGAKSLAQPIYFLDGEGAFSPTKTEASCNANMIETGTDDTGCRTFQAEQPDGTSSEVTYYRSRNGYTVKRDRSTCG